MKLKFLVDEDIANYYKTSMFIGFPHCSFKCDKECGKPICQNSKLANDPNIDISIDEIVGRYVNNPLTHSIVIGGLEPLDDFEELCQLILAFRMVTNDTIVIYTGYYPDEISEQVGYLKTCQNILIKYGRFIPNDTHRYDPLLGITLSSDNQYSILYVGIVEKDSRNEDCSQL